VAVDAAETVALVDWTTLEPTKALASPAPTNATDVTTMVGRIRRCARVRDSVRALLARFAAIR
jgi:hypothetical protein